MQTAFRSFHAMRAAPKDRETNPWHWVAYVGVVTVAFLLALSSPDGSAFLTRAHVDAADLDGQATQTAAAVANDGR